MALKNFIAQPVEDYEFAYVFVAPCYWVKIVVAAIAVRAKSRWQNKVAFVALHYDVYIVFSDAAVGVSNSNSVGACTGSVARRVGAIIAIQ